MELLVGTRRDGKELIVGMLRGSGGLEMRPGIMHSTPPPIIPVHPFPYGRVR